MRIGIDARMYGSKQAGLGRYVEQLVLGLTEGDRENKYILYVRNAKEFENAKLSDNFRLVEADIPWYSWEEQMKLPKIIKKEKVDLMHFPHWNVPLFYNKPFVVTIHDLIMYHYPRAEATTLGPVKYWFKDKIHRLVVKNAVRKARHIIVTSEFTKQDVHQTLKVPMEKMTVTYQAPAKSDGGRATSDGVLKKFGIDKKYILYVGNAYPHKNLEGLLKAWKIFREKYGEQYQLVLAGKRNYFYEQLIKKTVEQWNNIIFTDYVLDDELTVLYQNASLFIFPSLYEGFGLPPLEAMSYGLPVASSSASCLPEVLGEGALYFAPDNYEQMAEVIYRGLTDENIRFELRQKAREESGRYSGERMARETARVYAIESN